VAALTYPALDPVMFQIGPVAVRWYGLAYILGFAVAGWLFYSLNRRWRLGLTTDDALTAVLYGIMGVLVGGRLGYVIVYGGADYWSEPVRILQTWTGGMSWHGGFLGIVIAGLLLARRWKMPFLRIADLASVGAPVGFGLGRLANFVNNELWGRVTDVPWAMVFPGGGPRPRHPSQLYEAVLEGLVMFGVLLWVSRTKRPDGMLFGLFMTLYGTFRFVAEFFREPDPQLGFLWGGATMGQVLSVPLIVAGLYFVWRAVRRSPV
jgi:phosphatidylglycerol:prolipoprotein diacylglycerol transferase